MLRKQDRFVVVEDRDVADVTLEITDTITSVARTTRLWIGMEDIGNQKKSRYAFLKYGSVSPELQARKGTTASGLATLVLDWAKMNKASG
jgi:hypothetical protein